MSQKKTGTSRRAVPPAKSPAASPVLLGILGLALIGLIAAFVLLRGGTAPASPAAEISVADALAQREAGAFILDVREPSEWIEGHIPGATLIPLGQLASRIEELPKDQEIVVVCRSGNRSAQGRDILKGAGLTNVTSMAGGMNQWQSAGYPTVTGQ